MSPLRLKVPLPESGGEYIGFKPENYFRSPDEIAKTVQILEQELEMKKIARKRAEKEYDRDFGWFGEKGKYRFQGGVVGIVVGSVTAIAVVKLYF